MGGGSTAGLICVYMYWFILICDTSRVTGFVDGNATLSWNVLNFKNFTWYNGSTELVKRERDENTGYSCTRVCATLHGSKATLTIHNLTTYDSGSYTLKILYLNNKESEWDFSLNVTSYKTVYTEYTTKAVQGSLEYLSASCSYLQPSIIYTLIIYIAIS
ncbi:protein E55F [Elephant endotheliotropic herpesvirus 2]|nr:protein E55F [Elephant endotheliotropic herpesvirus 2]